MNWNMNGLSERSKVGRSNVRLGSRKPVEKAKVEEVVSVDAKERIKELTEFFSMRKQSIDDPRNHKFIEEYISLRFQPLFKNSDFIKYYGSEEFDVVVDRHSSHRNYIDMSITISTYSNKEYKKQQMANAEFSISLRELFRNCSSIVFTNARLNAQYHTGITGYLNDDILVAGIMDICLDIAKMASYTTAFYSSSDPETDTGVRNYLKKNWTNIKEFQNKRNKHTITYYTLDL